MNVSEGYSAKQEEGGEREEGREESECIEIVVLRSCSRSISTSRVAVPQASPPSCRPGGGAVCACMCVCGCVCVVGLDGGRVKEEDALSYIMKNN